MRSALRLLAFAAVLLVSLHQFGIPVPVARVRTRRDGEAVTLTVEASLSLRPLSQTAAPAR